MSTQKCHFKKKQRQQIEKYYSTSGILPSSLKCQLTLKQQLKYCLMLPKAVPVHCHNKNCISVKLKSQFSHSEARWDDCELLSQKLGLQIY